VIGGLVWSHPIRRRIQRARAERLVIFKGVRAPRVPYAATPLSAAHTRNFVSIEAAEHALGSPGVASCTR
jgi:hypothetical protein